MFDRTNQADLAALYSEVINDPAGMGYGVVDGDVNARKILILINDPTNNVGGDEITRKLTVRLILENLDPGEYVALPDAARQYLGLFLDKSPSFSLEAIKANLAQVFPAGGPTRTAIGSLSRSASRAEVLFGADTLITRADLIAARDNGA